MNFNLILKILGVLVLGFIGLVVIGMILNFVGLIISLLFGIGLIVGVFFLIKFLLTLGSKKAVEEEQAQTEYKLYDATHPSIIMFMNEPAVKDLATSASASRSTQILVDGSALEIDKDSQVIVLDNKREAVKIKVTSGKYQGRSGWVCRSNLVQAPKAINN